MVKIVIGSGPAGVACAQALISRGASVLMLDAGIELEPDRARIVQDLAKKNMADWQPGQIAAVRGDITADARGIPIKKYFGSDFPYRETEEKIPWRGNGVALLPSLALGGLSNVWGAALLPYLDNDISDWPIKTAQLEPHYRAVAELTGMAARHDDLEAFFPLHCAHPEPLNPSRQATVLLDNLECHRDVLRTRGWHFGQSRLAIRVADSPLGRGCVYCGHCMTGCAYGCIYNSADTVRALQAGENFAYQRDVIVTKIRENAGSVIVEGFHRQTRAPLSFEGERAYLASGVIPTAQILLRSQEAYDQPLTLLDSQYFLFPIVQARRSPGVQSETLHTLSQVFIELTRPEVSRRNVHLQVYTYSDIIGQAVRQSLGPFRMFARAVEERLLIVQGFLHSDDSSAIEMRLKRDGQRDCLELTPRIRPEAAMVAKRVLRELLKEFRALGGVVVPTMLQIAQPGRGFHYGGSVPMRARPGRFESDCLGRPSGWSRLHLVDGSVLPSIPATTITFSIMANAHRIGSETAS